MNNEDSMDRSAPEGLAQAILKAARGLRYGSIEIVVHDSKIVRVERRERIRLDRDFEESSSPAPTASAEANPLPRRLDPNGKARFESEP